MRHANIVSDISQSGWIPNEKVALLACTHKKRVTMTAVDEESIIAKATRILQAIPDCYTSMYPSNDYAGWLQYHVPLYIHPPPPGFDFAKDELVRKEP